MHAAGAFEIDHERLPRDAVPDTAGVRALLPPEGYGSVGSSPVGGEMTPVTLGAVVL
jgi:hypothetical protein